MSLADELPFTLQLTDDAAAQAAGARLGDAAGVVAAAAAAAPDSVAPEPPPPHARMRLETIARPDNLTVDKLQLI